MHQDVNWDENAAIYNQLIHMQSGFSQKQIDLLDLRSTDTVLDIGCGPGRTAFLIAPLVKKVVAMDSSPRMLDFCNQNCDSRGITNVDTFLADWNDDALLSSIGRFDVVHTSRSPAICDFEKLSSYSRRLVVVISWANGPGTPQLLNEMFSGCCKNPVIERSLENDPSYNMYFNKAYNLGYDPSIVIVPDGLMKTYSSRDEAFEDLRKLQPIPEERIEQFKLNNNQFICDNPDGSVTFHKKARSFVLYWDVSAKISRKPITHTI